MKYRNADTADVLLKYQSHSGSAGVFCSHGPQNGFAGRMLCRPLMPFTGAGQQYSVVMPKDHLLLIKFNKLYSALPNSHDSRGRILRILSGHDGISQSRLQDIMDIKPGSLSELLQKLENSGQIVRVPDKNDKRKRNIYITDAGREAFNRLHAEHESESKDFFDVLTDEEKDTLLNVMDKLLEKHSDHSKHDRKAANTGEFEE